MKKHLLLTSLSLFASASIFTGLALAEQSITAPSIYETTQNVNLRSSPRLGNNRIDYLQKGTQVIVEDIKGQWCQASHYKYPKAYLACRYLKQWNQDVIPLTFSTKDFPDKETLNIFFIGERLAMYNLNVRSKPAVGKNLIGNIKKGSLITVTDFKGDWCKVNYKTYQNAYVYCKALGFDFKKFAKMYSAEGFAEAQSQVSENSSVETPSIESTIPSLSVGNQSIESLYSWAIDNNEAGRFYINNSFEVGLKLAQEWHADANDVGLKFNWPKVGSAYCEIYFGSAADPDKVFVYTCAEPTADPGTTKIVNKSDLKLIDGEISKDFQVPFARLLGKFQDYDQSAWKSIDEYFRDSKTANLEFTLFNDAQGDHWNVEIWDENNSMLRFSADADTSDFLAPMMMFSGNHE